MSFSGCLRLFIVVYCVLYLLGFRFKMKTNTYLTLIGMAVVILAVIWFFSEGIGMLDAVFDGLFPGGDKELWK